MPSGQLLADMETAKDSLWKKHGMTSLRFWLNVSIPLYESMHDVLYWTVG